LLKNIEPLVIIDGGYLVTMISLQIASYTKPKEVKALAKDLLSELMVNWPNVEPIVALDTKQLFGYYTNLRADNYKSGRKPNPLRKKAATAIKSLKWSYGLPGLEADQIAGKLVQVACRLAPIFLLTQDTDWYQLQDDTNQVTVVDLYRSRYMLHHTDMSVVAYYQNKVPKKSDFVLQCPRDICTFKKLFGDKSDNLLPGADPQCYTL
jgi:5'-3' exonuclease